MPDTTAPRGRSRRLRTLTLLTLATVATLLVSACGGAVENTPAARGDLAFGDEILVDFASGKLRRGGSGLGAQP
ncbi:hypothetical protein ATL51_0066 [Pseudonocardia alni]|uniref:Uncharacterized protein n=1 Tax=Pseudonocardia alni TaxID=33907 RepID=A0AA44UVM2_PSEA5|nr:hypothetical protein ATL51_0066 [Pseudonocardia alni]